MIIEKKCNSTHVSVWCDPFRDSVAVESKRTLIAGRRGHPFEAAILIDFCHSLSVQGALRGYDTCA